MMFDLKGLGWAIALVMVVSAALGVGLWEGGRWICRHVHIHVEVR